MGCSARVVTTPVTRKRESVQLSASSNDLIGAVTRARYQVLTSYAAKQRTPTAEGENGSIASKCLSPQ